MSVSSGQQQHQFCTPQNLENSLTYINHALTSFGFESSLNLYQANEQEASKSVNCILTLLQAHQKHRENKDNMEDRIQRLLSDHDSMTASMERLKAKLETSEREADSLKSKLSVMTLSNLELSKENVNVKEELKVAKSNLQYSKNQYNHELRKKDKEFAKIQSSLQKMISDRQKAEKIPMKLVNAALPSREMNEPSEADDLNQEIIREYEERERILIEENQIMRELLFQSFKALKDYIRVKFGLSEETNSSDDNILDREQAEKALFYLPYDDTVGSRLDELLKEQMDQLEQCMELWRKSTLSTVSKQDDKTREVEALRKQLTEYKKVIDKQAKLIELSLVAKQKQQSNEAASKEAQQDALVKERRQLEEERKRFMDAAVKLGKERALFEQERDEFEQARMAVETQQVLKNLPSTPAWLKNSYNQLIKDKTLETPTAVVSRVTATAAINGHASHNSNEHAIEAIDKALANADLNNHNNQENVKSANVNKGKPPIMSTPGGALPAYLFQKSKQSPFDPQMSEIDQQTVENNTSPINNLTAVKNYKRQPLTSKVTFQE